MKIITSLILSLAIVVSCAPDQMESEGEVTGEWHHAGGTHFSEKYADLGQINLTTLSTLGYHVSFSTYDVFCNANLLYFAFFTTLSPF